MHMIDDERVNYAIEHAEAICRAPGIYKNETDRDGHASVDALYDYVQSQETVPIIMMDVAFEGRIVGSRLERFNDRIEIAVRSEQTELWKKFCATKELVHIIIDKAIDFSGYGNDRIEELLNKGLIGLASGANPTKSPTQSELVAEICAIEIMYPSSQVILDLEALGEDIASHRRSIPRVALERQMPNFYVGTALDPHFRNYLAEAKRLCKARRS